MPCGDACRQTPMVWLGTDKSFLAFRNQGKAKIELQQTLSAR